MQRFNARQRAAGLEHGWRSGLEERVIQQLKDRKVDYRYEQLIIPFTQPSKSRKYTPDFLLFNGIIIETKGRWETQDRHKHLLVQEQHPSLDIRLVFSNPNQRISKQSKTTYAMYCSTHGFLYAKGEIPDEWLNEAPDEKRLAAAREFFKGPTR